MHKNIHKYFYLPAIFIILLFCTFSCKIIQSPLPEKQSSKRNSKLIMVDRINHDQYYRPVLGALTTRSQKCGNSFCAVLIENNYPVISYNIIIKDINRIIDYKKPLIITYEWTSKGFETGIKVASQMGRSPSIDPRGFPGILTAQLVCISLGGPIGFVSGLGKGSYEFSRDIHRSYFIKGKEIILGYTKYFYDSQQRIVKSSTYVPYRTIGKNPLLIYNKDGRLTGTRFIPGNKPIEILTIEYQYNAEKLTPCKLLLHEYYPKNKYREIIF